MQIITGDETGLVKLIDLEKQEVIKKYGEQAKENKIIQIHKMNLSEINFFLILRETSLLILDNELNEIAQAQIDASPIKCFITKSNQIYVIYRNRKIMETIYDESENQFSEQKQINSQDFSLINNLKDKYVTSAALSLDESLLLVTYFGGPPSIFSLKTKSLYWQARNVKNDELDLQVKMYDYDGIFVDEYTIIVITVHQTFRSYSILKPKSQPLEESKILSSRTKVMQIRKHDQKYTMVNERGEILIFSKTLQFERSIKGTFGAIRDLFVHRDYIYTVGLDRFLRVYHLEDVKTPLSINLSQRLTAVNFNEIEEKEIIIEKKDVPVWNIKNGKEAKARFQGMRKNTIKLPYLEQMFRNHKLRKVKVEEQQIKQEEQVSEIHEKQEEQDTNHLTNGIQNKKIEKLKNKKRILALKKNKLLVNKPKRNKK